MIPPFDNFRFLPPGVHPATPAEIEASFGRESELRRVQMKSIHWMVDLALRTGSMTESAGWRGLLRVCVANASNSPNGAS